MLDELARAQDLADEPELLLSRFEGGDGNAGPFGTVEVPGVEAGKVLQRAQQLVAADWWGDGRGERWEDQSLFLFCLK